MKTILQYYGRRMRRRTASRLALLSSRFESLLAVGPALHRHEHHWGDERRSMVLLLPGIDDIPEDFSRRGLIRDLERHELGSGAVAVDAHYGYYASRSLHAALAEEVVRPARAHGYRKLIMIGISLGGFVALSYARRFPDEVDAVCLLAPYLGGRTLIREIADAGGVARWNPGDPGEHDHERQVWQWIKQVYAGGDNQHAIPLYLGYGNRDWMADAHRLLADVIPPERLFVVPGGHNWKTWKALWRHLLPGVKKDTDRGSSRTRAHGNP